MHFVGGGWEGYWCEGLGGVSAGRRLAARITDCGWPGKSALF